MLWVLCLGKPNFSSCPITYKSEEKSQRAKWSFQALQCTDLLSSCPVYDSLRFHSATGLWAKQFWPASTQRVKGCCSCCIFLLEPHPAFLLNTPLTKHHHILVDVANTVHCQINAVKHKAFVYSVKISCCWTNERVNIYQIREKTAQLKLGWGCCIPFSFKKNLKAQNYSSAVIQSRVTFHG